MEGEMARLRDGEREGNTDKIYWLLRRHYTGLREGEIADLTGIDRRRTNNYLRDLQSQDKIYREGRLWHAR